MKQLQRIALLFFLSLLATGVSLKAQQDAPQQVDTLKITLSEALEIALSENPIIKIAEKEVERTNYAKSEAIGNLIPSVSGSVSYQRALKDSPMFMSGDMIGMFQPNLPPGTVLPDVVAQRMGGLKNSYSAGISATIPIFSMGLYKNLQLANLNIQVALESARESKVSLKNEVEKAYYAILLAQNSYEVVEMSFKSAEDNYENVRLKFEQGKVAEFDKLRAEVQVSNVRPSFLQAKNVLQIVHLQLKMLMGLPLDIELVIDENLADYEEVYKNENLMAQGYDLANNTDLRKLNLQEDVLRKQIELQNTQRLPSLGAQFNYNFITQNSNFDFAHYIWYDSPSIGISLSIPIFNGLTLRNKDRQLKAGLSQLQLQKEYRVSSLNLEVRNAINTMDNAAEQIEANASIISQAEKAYDITKTRYDSGMGTLLELNDTEVALTQARLNYNQAIYSYLVAKSDYIKILGNSYQ